MNKTLQREELLALGPSIHGVKHNSCTCRHVHLMFINKFMEAAHLHI